MVSRHLLIGISTLALAAGTAHAQNNNNQITTSGSGSVGFCSNSNTNGNFCRIIQVGDNDFAQVTQGANDPTSTRNSGTITQIGDRNDARIQQDYGNDNAGFLFQGTSTQRASDNSSELIQFGYLNSATVRQNGNYNLSQIYSDGGRMDPNSTTGASLAGSGNIVTVTQNSSQDSATQAQTFSSVETIGNGNSVTVLQNGVSQTNFVVMGTNEFAQYQNQPNEFNEETTFSDNGSVTVVQNGAAGYSVVRQVTQTPGVRISNNVANVRQDSENSTGTGFGLPTPNSQPFDRSNASSNVSRIEQRSSGNSAVVVMTGGNNASGFGTTAANTQNTSTITQQNTNQSPAVLSNNVARAFLGRGDQLNSTIFQNGRNNFSEVTLASGVAGTNATLNRSTGNSSTVQQLGNGSVGIVVTQAGRGQTGQGIGNFASVGQFASANYSAPTGGVTTFSSTSETGYFPGSRGLYAVVYQQGQFGTVFLGQSDNGDSGRTYSNGGIARARAQVFQAGRLMFASVSQVGDNLADITQGRLGQDVSSSIGLSQQDAGDTSVAGGGFDPQGNPINNFARQSNTVTIVQYGSNNAISLSQNTRAGSATVFQSGGSGNNVDAQQGTGGSATFSGTGANQATTLSNMPASGSGTERLTLNVRNQGGSNNALRVRQDGTDLNATVTQVGTGAASGNAGGNTFNGPTNGTTGGQSGVANVIQIGQQGTNNQATAIQTANVGQSAAGSVASGTGNAAASPGAFTGGARSPEIDIFQSGTGQRAYAEQRGKGQVARIEQSGTNNTAGIL
ncbi:MAG TPA: hypothetical protein VF662_00530, partial [Allosphingosinicella sp.]